MDGHRPPFATILARGAAPPALWRNFDLEPARPSRTTRKGELLPQRRVYILQHPAARTKLFLSQRVERVSTVFRRGVQVFGIGIDVEQTGDDFAFSGVL